MQASLLGITVIGEAEGMQLSAKSQEATDFMEKSPSFQIQLRYYESMMLWMNCILQNSCTEALPPNALECECIWTWSF